MAKVRILLNGSNITAASFLTNGWKLAAFFYLEWEMEKTRETLAMVLDCLYEAEARLGDALHGGAGEREAMFDAWDNIIRAKQLAFEVVTLADVERV